MLSKTIINYLKRNNFYLEKVEEDYTKATPVRDKKVP